MLAQDDAWFARADVPKTSVASAISTGPYDTMNQHPTRALGIDFGERRIGLALSDPAGRYALPHTTLERQTDRRAIYQIAALARDEAVELLVLGEPRHTDGSASDTVPRIRRFGRKLARVTQLPIRWVDEALTTREARDRLRDAGMDDTHERQRRDMVAAQILLQEALDGGGIEELPTPRKDPVRSATDD